MDHPSGEDADNSTGSVLEGKRIIIVVADLELGGSERQALRLADYLITEKNARVEIWGMDAKVGEFARICEERGIPWRLIGTTILGKDLDNYGLQSVFRSSLGWFARRRLQAKMLINLTLTFRKAQPDVILSYLIFPNVACGLVWRRTGARVCIWNQRDAGLERLPGPESKAVQRVKQFVTNSEAGARFLTEGLGAPAGRIRIIHNAVQLTPAQLGREAWRHKLGLAKDSFAVCMVANFNKYKDHLTLLRAWRYVVDELEPKGVHPVLLLAGRFGETTDQAKILSFDLGLGATVQILGQVDDVSGLLSAIDLAVLSSPSESSPNGVLEAMAAGLPVVGTDNSGMREALGPEGSEFLAPAGDAVALADKILRLANDAALRSKTGASNRDRIEREFNPRQTLEQMASFIVQGLQEREVKVSTVAKATPYTPVANSRTSG